MQKYMTTQERGLQKPRQSGEWGHTIHVPRETAFLEGSNGVFLTTDHDLKLLTDTKPLLDRSNTPRKALKTITLDRNYTNKRWLYNKSSCDPLDPRLSKTDMKRGKELRRITKREDRLSAKK